MSDVLFFIAISFMGICAIYGLFHFIKSVIDKNAKNSLKPISPQGIKDGVLHIKRDSQGAQASVRFYPDLDLFKFKDGDVIYLEIKIEEVLDK